MSTVRRLAALILFGIADAVDAAACVLEGTQEAPERTSGHPTPADVAVNGHAGGPGARLRG